jgi:DNA segregation ATPase FtsK/SpoIIIE, S-DNA-T family
MLLAHLVGAAVRAAGARARDLDPAHRRDGAGFAVLAAALVVAGGVWWRLPPPVGPVVVAVVAGLFGAGAAVVPVLLVALAWRILRHPDRVTTSGRVVIGWTALILSALGLVHIAHGTPMPARGAQVMRHAGGMVGFMVASPLVSGVSTVLAIPLLALLGCFGVLVVTATPVNAIPRRLRELRDALMRRSPFGSHPGAETSTAANASGGPDLLIDLNAEPPAALRRAGRRRRVGAFNDLDDGAAGDKPFDTPLLSGTADPAAGDLPGVIGDLDTAFSDDSAGALAPTAAKTSDGSAGGGWVWVGCFRGTSRINCRRRTCFVTGRRHAPAPGPTTRWSSR